VNRSSRRGDSQTLQARRRRHAVGRAIHGVAGRAATLGDVKRVHWNFVVVALVATISAMLASCVLDSTTDPTQPKDVTFTIAFTDFPTEMFPCTHQSLDPNGGTLNNGLGQVRFSLEDASGSTVGSALVTGFEEGKKYCVAHITLPLTGSPPYQLVAEGVANHVVQTGPTYSLKHLEDAGYQVSVSALDDFSSPSVASSP